MNVPSAIVVAAAVLAGAVLASSAWTQSNTTPFATAWTVAACGTPPTVSPSSGWSYVANNQAPLTMTTGGALCVNQ